MKNRKSYPRAAIVASTALLLAACGGGGGGEDAEVNDDGELVVDGRTIATADQLEQAEGESGLVLYTGSGETGERQLLEQFTEDTGLSADLVRLVPNRLTERILSEHGSDQLGADVIRIDGWDLIEQLVEDGAFVEHEVPDSIELPDEAIHEGGQYFMSYNRPYVFAYNNQLVDDELTSWADLGPDSFGPGEIGVTNVNVAGSTHLLQRFHLDVMGEEWLAGLADTDPRIFDSASPLTDSLARGEIRAGAVPLTVAQVAYNDGAPITIVAPEEGFPVNEYVVGLADGGQSPATAEIFMNWTLSTAGQAAATEIGDYPINPEVGAPSRGDDTMPALDSEGIYRVTLEEYLEHLEADTQTWLELFEYTG
ncbi:ABC-type Fe3+ transport system, periplasmic component [Actinomycetales bacterium JB111]|nr:ABC-type Fe3+ transport system, periplasmic component [Actinomycetales bacterium JB111]